MPISETYNMDCLEYMRQFPDKHFELAIVDPPYGLGFSDYERGSSGLKTKERYTKIEKKNWDNIIPNELYFNELKRVSINQIIWGANYFNMPPTKHFIFWYKKNPVPNFADGELAWTSFNKPAVCFDYMYYGNINSEPDRIHPTQKPVALYKWLLTNYAECSECGGSGEVPSLTIDCDVQTCKKCKGKKAKILDTHLGSQSSRIAAYDMGFDFYGTELDKDYFEQGNKRFEQFKAQLKLF